ncbi:MAG: fimbria/pilus periplasmic chaperone [Pacificimonas sp.]|jgi:P pilus assembly chaperone PapD|nr:fimbria/pilus periplasmic chaperone [Pacificimonas sp.]
MHRPSCRKPVWARGLKIGLTAQLLVAGALLAPLPAGASDLLVAPTRVTFEGRERATEVVLKNAGDRETTYRVSLVARRMSPTGEIIEVDDPNEAEALAQQMIRYAPRSIRLAPNQTQAIRVAVRKPADLADGEYRIHMMFQNVPEVNDVEDEIDVEAADALSIRLTPIYGVTIPIIVRHGALDAGVAIADAQPDMANEGLGVSVALQRTGTRSSYGEFELSAEGHNGPVALLRGVALYPEIERRVFTIPVRADANVSAGETVTLRYYELNGTARTLIEERSVPLG